MGLKVAGAIRFIKYMNKNSDILYAFYIDAAGAIQRSTSAKRKKNK
jgi:hypothetical protein